MPSRAEPSRAQSSVEPSSAERRRDGAPRPTPAQVAGYGERRRGCGGEAGAARCLGSGGMLRALPWDSAPGSGRGAGVACLLLCGSAQGVTPLSVQGMGLPGVFLHAASVPTGSSPFSSLNRAPYPQPGWIPGPWSRLAGQLLAAAASAQLSPAKAAPLCRAVPCRAILCCSTPCHAMPCHAVLCHAVPFHSTPFHSMPLHSVPFHPVPFHAVAPNACGSPTRESRSTPDSVQARSSRRVSTECSPTPMPAGGFLLQPCACCCRSRHAAPGAPQGMGHRAAVGKQNEISWNNPLAAWLRAGLPAKVDFTVWWVQKPATTSREPGGLCDARIWGTNQALGNPICTVPPRGGFAAPMGMKPRPYKRHIVGHHPALNPAARPWCYS